MGGALNSREWAAAVWLAVGLFACLMQRDLRSGFRGVRVALLHWKLALALLLMVAYIAVVIYGAAHVGLWESNLIGATVVWVFGSAVVSLMNSSDAPNDSHYMRAVLKRAVGVTILVEGFVNLYVLPFGVELLLVPTVTLLVAAAAVAEAKPELSHARAPINFLVGVIGVALLLYVVVRLVSSVSGSSLAALPRDLALPVWLSLALIPHTYLLGLLAIYELAFLQLRFAEPASPQALRRAKLALLLGARGRAHDLVGLGPPWTRRLVSAPNLVDARRIVAELRSAQSALTGSTGGMGP